MIDICLLGTGGMMPLPYRWLTSLMVRYNGKSILIDCGEGTQIAMKEKGWSPKPIDVICFTHYHADHISGLPGMFLTMGNAERTEPLLIIGPKGLQRVVSALRTIAPELPFPIEYLELDGEEQEIDIIGLKITAFKVNHSILCYGYRIDLERAGKFSVEQAEQLGIEKKFWNRLQKGDTLELDGKIYTPEMVLGPNRKGLAVTYCTDTRPTQSIVSHADHSDLFICEGMYGEQDKVGKAKENRHMTFYEAAELAKKANVNEMWLTHYSPSLMYAEDYMGAVRKIFPRAYAGKDGKSVELNFEEDK